MQSDAYVVEDDIKTDAALMEIFECASDEVVLSGHSFGGATVLDL